MLVVCLGPDKTCELLTVTDNSKNNFKRSQESEVSKCKLKAVPYGSALFEVIDQFVFPTNLQRILLPTALMQAGTLK